MPLREDRLMAETPPIAPLYEPPRVERVLTAEDLAQEVLYAGPPAWTDFTPL
jgi:hypothetical protein